MDNSDSHAVLQFYKLSSSSHSGDAEAVTFILTMKSRFNNDLGPMVDGGTPYSAIGIEELSFVNSSLKRPSFTIFDPLFVTFSCYKWWQYGSSEHASPHRKILRSFLLLWLTNNAKIIKIRHLVVAGPS